MRINILLLILIVQQSASQQQSFYKMLNFRASLRHHNNEIANPRAWTTPLKNETRAYYFANYFPMTQFYSMDGIDLEFRSNDLLDRRMPKNIFDYKRKKSPPNSNREKLTNLLNNYKQVPIQPEMNLEEGNKNRAHLFGFWTNYLARIWFY